MNDDLQKQPVSPITESTSPPPDDPEPVSTQIFDVSDDSISPVTDEPEPVVKQTSPTQSRPATSFTPQQTPKPQYQYTPQPVAPKPAQGFIVDRTKPIQQPPTDLLDKKIGSLQTSPFAQNSSTDLNQSKPLQPDSGERSSYLARIMPGAFSPTRPPVTANPSQTPIGTTRPPIPAPPIPKQAPVVQRPPVTPPTPQRPAFVTQTNPSFASTPKTPKSLQEAAMDALPSYLRPQQSTPTPAQQPAPSLVQQLQQETSRVHVDPSLQQNIKPIRTYEGDIAEIMSRKRTSTASIAIAEQKKQTGEERIGTAQESLAPEPQETSHALKKIILLIIGLVFIAGGAFGAYYLYMRSPLAPVTPVTTTEKAPSLIPIDDQLIVVLDSQSPSRTRAQIIETIASAQSPNTIREIIPAIEISGQRGKLTSTKMLELLSLDVPDILKRSLAPDWIIGVYANAQGEKDVFVTVSTTFFQNTFAGMLQWERVMADDLRPYLFTDKLSGIANISEFVSAATSTLSSFETMLPNTSTSTATTTRTTVATTTSRQASTTVESPVNPLRSYSTIRGSFEDRIVKNRDVRLFKTTTGEILFLYSFIDNQRLVVAGNEQTLVEIMNRLEKQSFVR